MADADAVRGAGGPGPPERPTPPRPDGRCRRAGDAGAVARIRRSAGRQRRGDDPRRSPDRAPDPAGPVHPRHRGRASAIGFLARGSDPEDPRQRRCRLPRSRSSSSGPGDGFAITLRIAIVVGIILAMPVLLYQLWAFIAPGPDAAREAGRSGRGSRSPCSSSSSASRSPTSILPFAIGFLLGFTNETIVAHLAAPAYFDFVSTLFLVVRAPDGVPDRAVRAVAGRDHDLGPAPSSRRMIILGIAIFAAVATPGGDLVSPTVLGVTMYILFELTIIAIRRSGK